MPQELKSAIRPRLEERAKQLGLPDLVDKIADETVATDTETLLAYLQQVSHPALEMEPLI
jgi:acetyl-CoA synthase